MTVRGVFVETHVRHHEHLRDPEENHGGDAEANELLSLRYDFVRRHAENAGQGRNLLAQPLAVSHEERRDETVGRQPGLADEGAQRGRAAKAAKAQRREARHGTGIYVPAGSPASVSSSATASEKRASSVTAIRATPCDSRKRRVN